MSENQIRNVLIYYQQHFERFKHIHDAQLLYQKATKLAESIKKNKSHELRPLVYWLQDKMPVDRIF